MYMYIELHIWWVRQHAAWKGKLEWWNYVDCRRMRHFVYSFDESWQESRWSIAGLILNTLETIESRVYPLCGCELPHDAWPLHMSTTSDRPRSKKYGWKPHANNMLDRPRITTFSPHWGSSVWLDVGFCLGRSCFHEFPWWIECSIRLKVICKWGRFNAIPTLL